MRLFQWLKFGRKDPRKAQRSQARADLQCYIQTDSRTENSEAWICDVSQTGLGFLTRSSFEIGDSVRAHLQIDDKKGISTRGQIVGQDILYYGPEKIIEKSFFRYSVHFKTPLEEHELKQLRRN